jgi:hypothetical protein
MSEILLLQCKDRKKTGIAAKRHKKRQKLADQIRGIVLVNSKPAFGFHQF